VRGWVGRRGGGGGMQGDSGASMASTAQRRQAPPTTKWDFNGGRQRIGSPAHEEHWREHNRTHQMQKISALSAPRRSSCSRSPEPVSYTRISVPCPGAQCQPSPRRAVHSCACTHAPHEMAGPRTGPGWPLHGKPPGSPASENLRHAVANSSEGRGVFRWG
jgi:hypothetical protein